MVARADRTLWERWRRERDAQAFETLVGPHLRFALDHARRAGCSAADADDVVQQSLTLLVEERTERPAEVGVRAWLGRSVSLQARMLRRSDRRRARREQASPAPAEAATDVLESRDEVETALAALPADLREAVALRYLHDLEYREMAHVLGVSMNACRIRVHRGLETLRERLHRHPGTELAMLPLLAGLPGADLVGRALAAAKPVGVAALLGGVLVMKKVAVGIVVVALAAVGVLVHSSGLLERGAPAPARNGEARTAEAPRPAPEPPAAETPAREAAPPAAGEPTLIEQLRAADARLAFDSPPSRWYGSWEDLPEGPVTGVWGDKLGPLVKRLDEIPTLRTLQLFGASIVDLEALARLPALESLHLGRTGVADEDMVLVGRMTSLRSLALHNTKVTDEGLAHLKGLPQLRVLDVHDIRIGDEGLAHLGKLATLEELELGETRVTDGGLRHLSGLSLKRLDFEKGGITGGGLRHLDLSRLENLTFEEAPRTDDSALAALRGARALKSLNLEETAVTDAGLAHLAECRSLEWLDVDHTRVSDKGLAHLAELPLKLLSIDDTFVTDAGVEHLLRMRALKKLQIEDTKITEAGVARLKAGLPDCEVRQ